LSRFTQDKASPIFAQTLGEVEQRKKQEESASFSNTVSNVFRGDVWSAAIRMNDPVRAAFRASEDTFFNRSQDGYKITPEKLQSLTEGVDPVFWDEFHDASSDFDANWIRMRALQATKDRATIMEAGWGGALASMGWQAFNPTAVAAGLATGGATTVNAVRSARVARWLEAGVVNAAPQIGLDALTATNNPDLQAVDIASGGAGAFALGAVLPNITKLSLIKRAGAAGGAQAGAALAVDSMFSDRAGTERAGMFAMNLMFGAGIGAMGGTPKTKAAAEANADFTAYGQKLHQEVESHAKFQEGYGPKPPDITPDDETLWRLAGFDSDDIELAKAPVASEVAGSPVPRDVLYHGTRSNDISSFIDSEGNLVLKPSSNFDGKQYGVSLTQQLDVANDYRTRVPGDAMRSDAQGYVFEISADAIPSSRRKVQSDTEIQVNDGDVVIPKGKYKIIKDPSASDGLVAWESARTKEAASYSDQELANAWKTQDNSASVSEHFHENQDGGKIASGVSQDIAAKYGKSNPELWFTNQELDKRIALSANPEAEAEKFAKLIGDSPFYSTEWLKTNLLETAMAYKAKQPAATTLAAFPRPMPGGVIDNKPAVRPAIVNEVARTPQSYFVPGKVAVGEVPFKENFVPGDLDLSGVSAAKPSLAGGRIDPLATIGRQGTDTEKLLANSLAHDPFGKVDGSPSIEGAEGWANSKYQAISGAFEAKHNQLFAQFLDEVAEANASLPPGAAPIKLKKRDFNELVWHGVITSKKQGKGIVVDGPEPLVFAPAGERQVGARPDAWQNYKSVRAAVENYQKQIPKETLDMMKRHGVRGAELIDDDPSFVSVVANREALDAYINTAPENLDRIREVVAEGVMRKMKGGKVDPFATLFPLQAVQEVEDIRKTVAVAIADQWINNIGTHNEEMARATRSALTSQQTEALVPMLQQKTGLDEKAVRSILFEVTAGDDKPATPASFLKPRIDIDYTVSKTFADGKTVRLSDYLEKDIVGLTRRYVRKATGAAAMAEVGRVAKHKLGLEEAPATIDEFLALAQVAQQSGGGDDKGRLAVLDSLLKKTYGYPNELKVDASASDKLRVSALRLIRAKARFRTMTTLAAAINQSTEFAGIIAKHGMGIFFDALPAARQFIKEVESGNAPSHGLMALALRDGIGLGSITERMNTLAPMDDATIVMSGKTWQERLAGKADKASMALSRSQQVLSGDAMVRHLQERTAYFSAAEELARQAKGMRERIADAKQLSDMGVTKAQYDKIMSHLEKNAVQTDIDIHDPNVDKWKNADGTPDLKSQAVYSQLLKREASESVNSGQSTLLPAWTDSTIGKLFSQLSTYGIQSYTTRLLPIVRNPGELRTYSKLLHLTTASLLGYVTWTYMSSLGRPDQKEFLKRRLSPSELAKAAFSRSSWTSLLPRFVDAGMAAAGEGPLFAPQRVSGVGSSDGSRIVNILGGSPAIEDFTKTIDAIQGVTLPWMRDDYDFSKRDVRNILDGWGIPNYLNARNFVMRATNSLPERPN